MMTKNTQELGEVLKTRSVEALKEFYIKHYGEAPEVDDLTLEVSMHKMICNRMDMPKDLVMESFKWLIGRGYRPRIY